MNLPLLRSPASLALKTLLCALVMISGEKANAQDPEHPNRVSLITYGFGLKEPDRFRYLSKPYRVKAMIGARFGMDYMFLSPPGSSFYFTKVWRYPRPVFNPNTGETSSQLNIDMNVNGNERNYAGFILEYPHELQKGIWSLEFYYKNKLVYKQEFELY